MLQYAGTMYQVKVHKDIFSFLPSNVKLVGRYLYHNCNSFRMQADNISDQTILKEVIRL